MTTTRRKLLAYFKKQPAASAAQIGRALNMSAANVRHHLSIMLADGRLRLVGLARKEGRGRPVKLYGLSENLLGDNWALLSDGLLDEFLMRLSPAQRDEVLRALAGRLALASQAGQTTQSSNAAKRLAEAVRRLDGLHYAARWEAGAEGPRVLFARCPYAAIIDRHPELCQMDAALLEHILGLSARQVAKIGESRSALCIFALGMPAQSTQEQLTEAG